LTSLDRPAPVVLAVLVITTMLAPLAVSRAEPMADARRAAGKQLAMTRSKGNCLACHMIDDGELPGNLGPPLVAMQARFPDRSQLRAQIWDATARNPNTRMPPFGKHGILSEEEIDLIVEYVYTL